MNQNQREFKDQTTNKSSRFFYNCNYDLALTSEDPGIFSFLETGVLWWSLVIGDGNIFLIGRKRKSPTNRKTRKRNQPMND
jgi:hypothetical protein